MHQQEVAHTKQLHKLQMENSIERLKKDITLQHHFINYFHFSIINYNNNYFDYHMYDDHARRTQAESVHVAQVIKLL